MSNKRRPGLFNVYRSQFLRSPVWFARRDRWFTDHTTTGKPLTCAACGREATKRQLELHHLDYARVTIRNGRWHAGEEHTDLVPLHPYCHELLHRLMDRDTVLAKNRTRRDATTQALQRLRARLTGEPVR